MPFLFLGGLCSELEVVSFWSRTHLIEAWLMLTVSLLVSKLGVYGIVFAGKCVYRLLSFQHIRPGIKVYLVFIISP